MYCVSYVHVVCRPKACVNVSGDKQIQIETPGTHKHGHSSNYKFNYDHSFWSVDSTGPGFANQEAVYAEIGVPVVQSAFAGFNTCVLAYGQTGTGKTYTMSGPGIDGPDAGLIPRICRDLFSRVESDGGASKIEVSYYEIYMDNVYDLLVAGTTTAHGTLQRNALKV